MFNQINLSSIYIMKINYILLGVTIILIILMMCSNKTEGFREGQYKVEARSQGCAPGAEIKSVAACKRAASIAVPKLRRGGPIFHGPGGNPLARAFGLSMFKGCSVKDLRGNPSFGKYTYFNTAGSYRGSGNANLKDHPAICKSSPQHPKAAPQFAGSVRLAPLGQLCPELERIKTPAECGRALLKLRDEQKDGDLFKSGTGLHGASSPGSSQWAGFGDSRFGYKGKILHPLEGNFSGVPQGCGVHTSYRGRQRKSHNYVYWNRQNPRLAQGAAQMYQAVCGSSPKAAPPPAKEGAYKLGERKYDACKESEKIKTKEECARAAVWLRDNKNMFKKKQGLLFIRKDQPRGRSSDANYGYKSKASDFLPLAAANGNSNYGCNVFIHEYPSHEGTYYLEWNTNPYAKKQSQHIPNSRPISWQSICKAAGAPKAKPCPPRGAAPKISEITGDYDVYYKGVKRTGAHNGGRGLQITCDGVATQPGVFIDKIHSKDVEGKCKEERDCQGTFYITKTHGANKHECLRKEGDKIVGNHYINNGQFWGAVEYRPKANQDPKYDCNKPPPPPPPPPPKRSNAAKPEPPPEPPAPPPPVKKKQQCPKLELAPKPSWCKALDGPLVDDPAPPEPVEERGGPKQPPPAPAPIPPAPPPPPKIISAPPPAPPPLPPPPPPPISPKPKSTCGSDLAR